jgi:O-antigen ligase
MKKFWESPIIGLGFTDEYYENQDGHVGNQNILLNVGIFGYILLIGLFIRISRKIWKMSRRMEFRIYENRAPLVYLFGLIAIFIIHSSSGQFWGYILLKYQVMCIAFFMAAVNAVYLSRQNSMQ